MSCPQTSIPRPHTSTEEGFTLIEVMVALVIFAFGILAVLGMQTTAIRGGYQSQNLSEAASIGANKIEDFVRQEYADLVNGIYSDTTTDGKFTRTWEIKPGKIKDTKAVDLSVTWTEGGRTPKVTYEFLKAKDI